MVPAVIKRFNTEHHHKTQAKLSERSSPQTSTSKKLKMDTDLVDVSTRTSGSYTITDYVTVNAVSWRSCCYKGLLQCSRKVDNPCSCHPDTPSKDLYRLRVLLKQDNAELWVTAFSDIAVTIMGMSSLILLTRPDRLML